MASAYKWGLNVDGALMPWVALQCHAFFSLTLHCWNKHIYWHNILFVQHYTHNHREIWCRTKWLKLSHLIVIVMADLPGTVMTDKCCHSIHARKSRSSWKDRGDAWVCAYMSPYKEFQASMIITKYYGLWIKYTNSTRGQWWCHYYCLIIH